MKRNHKILIAVLVLLVLFTIILSIAMLALREKNPGGTESDTPNISESKPTDSEFEPSESKPEDSNTSESEPSVHTHIEETIPGKVATCIEPGLTDGKKCSICGEIIVEQTEIPALGHTYENGICKNCKEPTPSEGLEFTLNSDNQSYSVSGIGTCKDTDVVIPSTYNDKPITSIGDSAFYDCRSLTSITIPNSLTSVGSDAFSGCKSLRYNEYDNAYYLGNQTNPYVVLVKVKDKEITSFNIHTNTKVIYQYAFQYCRSLTSITIPNSVTNIGNGAFSGCNSLESITLPFVGKSVTASGHESVFGYIFGYTTGYYSSAATDKHHYRSLNTYYCYSIPDSLKKVVITGSTSIGYYAFYKCTRLTSVTIGNSVTSIGYGAFYYCRSLTSVTIGNSVTSIGDLAFSGCSSLTSVTIPDSVTSIGKYAFYDCSSLTSVTIGNSVTSIGSVAFSGCSSLTSITIPNSVTSVGSGAFGECKSLRYNEYGNAYYLGNQTNPYVVLVKVKDEEITSFNIHTNAKVIYQDAFQYCRSLTSITIPNGVTNIGKDAFSKCTRLTSITIPNSVTSVGSGAFGECNSLRYNEYDNAYYLGNQTNPYVVLVKAKDKEITSCNIHTNTKVIYQDAFKFCRSLTSITIPNSVTSIGDEAFCYCSSLTSVTIPNSVTSIGYKAFYECKSIKSITIGNSVTSIGESAFEGCSSLTSITIPNSVTSIGFKAFFGCESLTSVTIGNSVTSIFSSVFSECENLMSITIPNSVTNIGYQAFYECKSIKSITFNGTKEQWNGISKDGEWKSCSYVIHCTDGDISM